MTSESQDPSFMRHKNMLVLFVRPSVRYDPQSTTDVHFIYRTKWVLPRYFYYDIKSDFPRDTRWDISRVLIQRDVHAD